MKKLIWLSLVGFNSLAAVHVYAQSLNKISKSDKQMILGVQIGQQYSFDTHIHINPLCGGCYTSGMYLKKYINKKLALETEINYTTNRVSKTIANSYNSLSVPLSVQYYPLSRQTKLQPYIGVGAIYTLASETNNTIQSNNAFTDVSSKTMTTKKQSVNIVVSQGAAYNISPKIQIQESIHFVPKSKNCGSIIGFNLGVGYKL